MFVLLMYETMEKFVSDQIVIKLSENRYSIAEVPFPAVTFCPEIVELDNLIDKENSKRLKSMKLALEK
jgi:Amiloride-sensitive sodium channel